MMFDKVQQQANDAFALAIKAAKVALKAHRQAIADLEAIVIQLETVRAAEYLPQDDEALTALAEKLKPEGKAK